MLPLHLGSLVSWALLGAAAAGLGAFLGFRHLTGSGRLLGLAGALSAGMMLGVGYASLTAGLAEAALGALLGAGLGVVVVRLLDATPVVADALKPGDVIPADARAATTQSALHSAAEGVAIGAAAAVDAWFGLFLVATFAIHNVSEGAVLGDMLNAAGWSTSRAVVSSFLTRLAQPALAAAAFTLVGAVHATHPWMLGASFGALLYLIVAELLPQSYQQAGRTAIALVFSAAAGVVAALGGRAP